MKTAIDTGARPGTLAEAADGSAGGSSTGIAPSFELPDRTSQLCHQIFRHPISCSVPGPTPHPSPSVNDKICNSGRLWYGQGRAIVSENGTALHPTASPDPFDDWHICQGM